MRGHSGRLVIALALVVTACAGETGSVPSTVESTPGLDLTRLPEIDESIAGLVDAEVEIRQSLQEGMDETLEEMSAGFRERFDSDLAEHGWSHLVELADDAGLGPLAASGLTLSLGEIEAVPLADWGGSMQAVSGNFTISMFLAMILTSWQQLSDGNWNASGELPPDVHDRVVDGIAEHSEMRTSVNGSARGDQLHFEVEVSATATLTKVSNGEVVATYTSTGRGLIEVRGCPDPDGVAEGHFTLDLQEAVSGSGSSASGRTEIDGPFRIVNNDEASLVRTDFEGKFDSAANGNSPSGEPFDWSVESTFPLSIPADGGLDVDEANATYQETNPSGDRAQRSTTSAIATAANFLSGVAKEAEKFWRSGKCVDLETSEESRKVDAGEIVEFDVESRQHFDGGDIDRPVTATFSGEASIEPAGTPIDPPATFTFTAGSDDGAKGTIHLEQKSKRGIGKKTLEFEVAGGVIVSISATGDFEHPGGVSAHGNMEVSPITLDPVGDGVYEKPISIIYNETFALTIGLGTCSGEYAGAFPGLLRATADGDDSYVVELDVGALQPTYPSKCQIVTGQTVEFPSNAGLFMSTFDEMLGDGVVVQVDQTATLQDTDVTGNIARNASITVTRPEE